MNMRVPTFDPIAPFLDAVPVDGRTIMIEALHFARQDRQLSKRLFGDAAKTIFECVVEGMAYAVQREEARRHNKANAAYAASLHPLERERRALDLELTLLRDKLLGAHINERSRITSRMAAYSARIAEIETMQAQRRAA